MRNQVQARKDEKSGSAHPTTPGGSAGIVMAENDIVQIVGETKPLPVVPASAQTGAKPIAAGGPKKYRVTHGGYIMAFGCRTLMRVGKEVYDHQVDIASLRKQGIVLQEIVEE